MDQMIDDTVVLKCETQKAYAEISKRSNVWELLLSVATTYSYLEDSYKIWTFSKKDDLLKYLHKKHIVCFNGVKFDLPLLFGPDFQCDQTFFCTVKDREFASVATDLFLRCMLEIYRLQNYTPVLFEKIHKHPLPNMQTYSMYNLYKATLNKTISKNILDFNAIESFKQKKFLDIIEFNLCRLRIVKSLYEFVSKYSFVVNGDYDILKVSNIPKPSDTNFNIDVFLPF